MSKLFTYSLLVFVMFTWGLNIVAIKYMVTYLPPIAMQGIRIFVAGLAALIVLYFLRDLRKLTRSEWKLALMAAVFGQLGHHTFLALGLAGTTATNGGLILGLIPLTTVIMTMIFLRERPTWLRFFGIFLGFLGVAMVVLQIGEGIGAVSRGDLFIFISMVSQAFSFILIRKITVTLSPRQLTAILLLIGSLMTTSASFIFEGNVVSAIVGKPSMVWVVFFFSAIIATGLGHIFYNLAIQQIGAGETAIFNNLVPFFTLVGAFLFLKEAILLAQVIGFILIVIGVFLGTGYLEMKTKDKLKYKKTG
ncbi:DMT family transporter [Anaerobacillus alkaliphilus]|uniref:DMT family transporter n=1 Tax=Anaerobacillus alkaliphilus TaxID=1548597 RepID=A0A4Q0VXI1_9BACI|nr:DMT family transporter [Anaerobacillus alkaliphilus]RXJ04239.1 DMT family transporter [Anaerobacillus alkaliphilus]